MPQLKSALLFSANSFWPRMRVNVAGRLPLAVTLSVKVPACGLLRTALTWTLVTSVRLNSRIEDVGRLRVDLRLRHGRGIPRQHQAGRVERCEHRRARRRRAAVVDRRARKPDDRNDRKREQRRDAAALVGEKT